MYELNKIKRLVETYDNQTLELLSAPFLFRTFVFFLKEFPQYFKGKGSNGVNYEFVLENANKTKFRFIAERFSCNRYIVNKKSQLFISHKNSWRLAGFDDFNLLFKVINQQRNADDHGVDTISQINKLKQQARYYTFVSVCTDLTRNKLLKYFKNEKTFYQKTVFNRYRRNLAFLLMDCFGVVNGHLDHPTPYPYSDSLSINLLGNDPFLSFLNIIDDIIFLDDDEFARYGAQLSSADRTKKNINGLDLVLVPNNIFDKNLFCGLSELSSVYLQTVKVFFDKKFSYDATKYFLLAMPKIEKKLMRTLFGKDFLSKGVVFLNHSLLAVSTSSGRSMIVPVSDNKRNNLLYIKTSWPDVKKTSLNRGLSPSKIQWFKICNQIYGNLKNKYFDYLTESYYDSQDINNGYFTFIERNYEPVINRKGNEFVLPLIGLVVPNHPFCGEMSPISYLANQYGGDKFIRKIIKCITNTLVFQLLNKGVFHGLHLQNCCILFCQNGESIFPKKVVIRDGDIRICKDYLGLLSEKELSLIKGLTKKRGKINSKSKFYKYLFHNIINENFGNIEQCLMEDNNFKSAVYWKNVYDCFIESINENVCILKKEGRFNDARSAIVDDFKEMIFMRSGYSANFFEMEYLEKDEGFIKVNNPFKHHKII